MIHNVLEALRDPGDDLVDVLRSMPLRHMVAADAYEYVPVDQVGHWPQKPQSAALPAISYRMYDGTYPTNQSGQLLEVSKAVFHVFVWSHIPDVTKSLMQQLLVNFHAFPPQRAAWWLRDRLGALTGVMTATPAGLHTGLDAVLDDLGETPSREDQREHLAAINRILHDIYLARSEISEADLDAEDEDSLLGKLSTVGGRLPGGMGFSFRVEGMRDPVAGEQIEQDLYARVLQVRYIRH